MPDDKKPQIPEKQHHHAPGQGLDKSNEGAVITGGATRKPVPPDAPPDRHTTDSRRNP
jgi:hypothetical protein